MFFVAEAAYSGSSVGVWEFGTTITASCLITMLVHGAIEIKSWVCRTIERITLNATLTSFLLFFSIPFADNTTRSVNSH